MTPACIAVIDIGKTNAKLALVEAETYQREFVPYGTPCSERFDPATQQLEILKCEVEALRAMGPAWVLMKGGHAEGDTLTGIENLIGSHLDDQLRGEAGGGVHLG